MFSRRRGADQAGQQREGGLPQGSDATPGPALQAVLDRLEEHQAWVAERFEELVARLDRIEAELSSGGRPDEEAEPRRGKGKQGLSRDEVLAIRATKRRARRAAQLKAKREASPESDSRESASG